MKKSVFLTKGKKDMIASGQYDEYIFASPVYRFDNMRRFKRPQLGF